MRAFRRTDSAQVSLLVGAMVVASAFGLTGCGNAIFAIRASAASRNLEQAREMGAETLAPYEFYYAEEHLKKAQMEASEADYGDARLLAAESNEYALKAIRVARGAHRGAGR
jgi:hypothetical protein